MGTSKTAKTDKKKKLIAGLGKHFGKGKPVPLKGTNVKASDLIAGLQKSVDARAATATARTSYLAAAKMSREADAAIDPQVVLLTDYLQSSMSATDLADFGLKETTRAVPDVTTKAVAIVKRAATRRARGTMGRRQRSKIVGVVSAADAAAAVAQATGATGATGPGGKSGTGN